MSITIESMIGALRRHAAPQPLNRRFQALLRLIPRWNHGPGSRLIPRWKRLKLNGHDPWAYLKDVFERLPTLKDRDLAQLLPHNWRPAAGSAALAPVQQQAVA